MAGEKGDVMASVFKRGKRWYARFRNVDGNWEKELGFTDKAATMQLATKREHEADLVRKGSDGASAGSS